MEKIVNEFEEKKNILLALNRGDLNDEILSYINEARENPQNLSKFLMANYDEEPKFKELALFFKHQFIEAPELILDKNLCDCCKCLLYEIISLDDGTPSLDLSEKSKQMFSLKKLMAKKNLAPNHYKEFVIIDAFASINSIIRIILSEKYREKLINPKMKYIGIASSLLPSDRLCIVIDIVQSISIKEPTIRNKEAKIFSYSPYKKIIYENKDRIGNLKEKRNNYLKNEDFFNLLDNKKTHHYLPVKKIIFHPKGEEFLRIESPVKAEREFKKDFSIKFSPNYYEEKKETQHDKFFSSTLEPYNYYTSRNELNASRSIGKIKGSDYTAIPIGISFQKGLKKNRHGKIIPCFTKHTFYEDGSELIQAPLDEKFYV